jgi:hypothetical protein
MKFHTLVRVGCIGENSTHLLSSSQTLTLLESNARIATKKFKFMDCVFRSSFGSPYRKLCRGAQLNEYSLPYILFSKTKIKITPCVLNSSDYEIFSNAGLHKITNNIMMLSIFMAHDWRTHSSPTRRRCPHAPWPWARNDMQAWARTIHCDGFRFPRSQWPREGFGSLPGEQCPQRTNNRKITRRPLPAGRRRLADILTVVKCIRSEYDCRLQV